MLRVNCGLSRKLTKDFQSTGYSLNVEGEITALPSDPNAVVEQIKEIFDLTEAALDAQIERSQCDSAIAAHDACTKTAMPSNGNGQRTAKPNDNPSANGNGHKEDAATSKQLQYLLSIGKRRNITTAALECEISQILGEQVGLYDLTKKQAGIVIDGLTAVAGSSRA